MKYTPRGGLTADVIVMVTAQILLGVLQGWDTFEGTIILMEAGNRC